MSSARYCLDDPDGYTVKEFAARVNDLIDAAVDDEAVQREALVDRNVKAMLDDVEAALNVRGSKPWRIEARDGKFCVLLEADGSVEKCFPTRQEAEQYMRALYANATEGEKRHEPPAHLEALEALEGVDSKAEKHRLLVLVAVGEERYLVQPNDVLSAVSDAPKALSPQAQKMLAEYDAGEARTKVVADREREEHKRFLQANEALLGGKIDWIAEDERDRERQARDLEAIERRAAEREQERAQADAADAARRDRGWHAGNADYYTEVIGGTPAPRQERTYREPNVIDATVGDLGDSFQIPTMPTERTDFGLPVPEAPLPEATVEPETFSGVPAFTVTPQAVPLTVDEEHFSVPMLSRELPTTVGTEPSVPSTPTTGGETVRLSTAGEVTNDVRTVTANEGETVRIPKASKPDGSRTVEK